MSIYELKPQGMLWNKALRELIDSASDGDTIIVNNRDQKVAATGYAKTINKTLEIKVRRSGQ